MILITGAAGKTGLAIIKALNQSGLQVRAWIRKADQAELVQSAGASETFAGNLESEIDLQAAMQGVDLIYFIPPNLHPQEDQIGKNAIVTALRSGLHRFIYHSVLYPQIENMPHHWRKLRVEESLIQSSLDFTILQPANYMQNVLAYRVSIESDGLWSQPYAPEARSTPVDLHDVAKVAAACISEDGHGSAIYPLAGPEALSTIDMAARIGRHIDKAVSTERLAPDSWKKSALANGLDAERINTLKQMFAYYDSRDFLGNSSVLTMLLERPPTSFEDFLVNEWV